MHNLQGEGSNCNYLMGGDLPYFLVPTTSKWGVVWCRECHNLVCDAHRLIAPRNRKEAEISNTATIGFPKPYGSQSKCMHTCVHGGGLVKCNVSQNHLSVFSKAGTSIPSKNACKSKPWIHSCSRKHFDSPKPDTEFLQVRVSPSAVVCM